MRSAMRVLALTAIGAAAFVPAAHAQDMTTATVNGTTIWVGGGVQFLSLPDIRFVGKGSSPTDMHRQKNSESDWSDFGGRDRRRHRDFAWHVGRRSRQR